MRPSVAPAAPLPAVDVEARLGLVEFLLTSTDLQASARRAVDWLVAHSDVDQAVVGIPFEVTRTREPFVLETGDDGDTVGEKFLEHGQLGPRHQPFEQASRLPVERKDTAADSVLVA